MMMLLEQGIGKRSIECVQMNAEVKHFWKASDCGYSNALEYLN